MIKKENTMKNWKFMSIALFFMAMSFKSSAQLCPIPATITISISGCGEVDGSYTLSAVSCQQVFGFINYKYSYQLANGDEIKLGGFNNYPVYLNQTYLTYYDASTNSYTINDYSNRYCSTQTMVWPSNFLSDFSPCTRAGTCTEAEYSENSDADGDGVDDADDLCADTPSGEGVNADGCSCSQVTVDDGDACTLDECVNGVVTHTFQDADNDGVCDANDICAGGDDNADNDGDGTPDFCDEDDDNDGIEDACDSEPEVDNYTYTGYEDLPESWKCGNNKVYICHGINNPQTNCVNKNSVQAHLNHGDYLGPCTSCGGQNMMTNPNSGIQTANSEGVELELFPNPAKNAVNIHLHGLEETAALKVFDQFGRTVWTQQLEERQHTVQLDLDGNTFQNGVYLVSIQTTQGEWITKRLMVVK